MPSAQSPTPPASRYETVQAELRSYPKVWLVTGAAGFIGSNLLEKLLKLDQTVVGLDNFATGHQHNLDDVRGCVSAEQWSRFRFIEGDICDLAACCEAVAGVDYVLHQAALGSVPRSIDDPIRTNESNVSGFLNMLVASRDAGVSSFTYAASSSTYGDHPDLPKVEDKIGRPLSPYAVTKYVKELYAGVFASTYGFKTIGLRYFNVFGPRQDPNGAYAAVIPKWIDAILRGETVYINGDGETSRDFCYVDNAVQANILAATADVVAKDSVYNIAVGERTTLNVLASKLIELLHPYLDSPTPNAQRPTPPVVHRPFRRGDVRHSQASIEKARTKLDYTPTHRIAAGLREVTTWSAQHRRLLLK